MEALPHQRWRPVRGLIAAVGAGSLLVLAPGVASADADADAEACGDIATLQELDALSEDCAAVQQVIIIKPGQEFAVPAPGTSVTYSAVVAEGSPGVPEVTVARNESLEIGVRIGEAGGDDTQVYGSEGALEELEGVADAGIDDTPISPAASSNPKCDLDPYSANAWRWPQGSTYNWYYKTSSLGNQAALSAALSAMADGTGACGKNVPNGAKHSYKGATTTASTVKSNGTCGPDDGKNVWDFGALKSSSTLASTCTYKTSSEIFGADVRFNSALAWFATTSASGCSGKYDLEGVATHEAGHVFGLNHVDQSSLQVMKPYSSKCETSQRKLGPGDLRGMKALFP